MHRYPQLTASEQDELPPLVGAPKALPSKFEDSTHRLWYCEAVDGPMVIKVCDHAAIAKSSFWHGMNQLFDVDFPNSLDQTIRAHTLLSENGLLAVPDIVAVKSNRYLLSRFLAGQDVKASLVTDAMVVTLAKHIARLHQQRHKKWGSLYAPSYAPADWHERLELTLQSLAEESHAYVPEPLLHDILAQTQSIHETDFVPIMLDLRWDQFRLLNHTQTQSQLALIDLDAFAVGPRALELVLLSYILTAPQLALFKAHYAAEHDWPDVTQQKRCYQLLLFLMNVLGEQDINRWLTECVAIDDG